MIKGRGVEKLVAIKGIYGEGVGWCVLGVRLLACENAGDGYEQQRWSMMISDTMIVLDESCRVMVMASDDEEMMMSSVISPTLLSLWVNSLGSYVR